MTGSLFQKEVNDQILVRDLNIANPSSEMLDETYPTTDTKCFTAKPFHVLKIFYSDSDSLSAFSKDELSSYYVLHHRDRKAERIFLKYTEANASESLGVCAFADIDSEVQEMTPAVYR